VFFDESELIVSKTDLKGAVTYANNTFFLKVSGYGEEELLGQPHSILRHPDMPRCAFKLLWQEIEAGREIFAYVVNLAKNGDHYWVFAHVTPTIKDNGSIIGYHSSRRVPSRTALGKVIPSVQTTPRD
jgi:PAS domain S-box-containing protein